MKMDRLTDMKLSITAAKSIEEIKEELVKLCEYIEDIPTSRCYEVPYHEHDEQDINLNVSTTTIIEQIQELDVKINELKEK